jgi:hypothetical protein
MKNQKDNLPILNTLLLALTAGTRKSRPTRSGAYISSRLLSTLLVQLFCRLR